MLLAVLVVGLLMNAVALPLAAKRVLFLYRAISHGQPAPDRIEGVTGRLGAAVKRQLVEVFGQKKMLKWTVPGTAHFFVMWAFFILATVYLEAYGSLIKLLLHGGSFDDGVHLSWAIPLVGHWAILGFLQDFIAVMALFGLVTFYMIRLRNRPQEKGRSSRFFGSHLGPAYLTLFMIFNVIWTMFLFRAAGAALGTLPYKSGAFASIGIGKLLDGLSEGALETLEGVGLLLHIGVMLVFLIFVLNSKHLHIFLAPLNVLFGREPVALGAAKPMMSDGKALTLEDLEEMDEDTKLGVGAAEDFSWKGVLDMATCTECGRCQSQCPAWNTEKPLSPKLLMMALRDHTLAKTPYLLADEGKREAMLENDAALKLEVERPLVGDTGDDWFYMPENGGGAIDPDVLWSCVTCGACVQQCPVDIEHVDHIVDMRRYQVLVESNFPAELNGLFKGMENKGNPWNMSATARMDWAKDLPFEVKVVGEDIESLDEVEWLFWVGCAGAYEDRAKKTTRAVAELLDMAGVSFGVLGNGETCTGDSARRAGNEFVFQGLAQQNIETFKEYKVKKAVTTCAHCFNTLKNEYKQLGIELEVVHHTQLLNRLVREKKLAPVAASNGSAKRSVTYHDPCYVGRHNQVYNPPRELLQVIPDADFVEMPRNSERSFCCGAGGARMWMEETIGTRINETRTKEAIETGADQIAVACPFCRVMLSDGLTSAQSKGEAREEVEVLDVAQMLLASVKGEAPKAKAAAGSGAAAASGGGGTATLTRDEETAAEPEADDTTQTSETVSDHEDVGAAAKASSGGGSLFDLSDDEAEEEAEAKSDEDAKLEAETKSETAESITPETSSGGSLFDLGGDEEDPDPAPAEKEPESKVAEEPQATQESGSSEIPEGGSLFDLGDDSDEQVQDAGEDHAEEPVDRAADAADTDVAPDQADTYAESKAEAEREDAGEDTSGGGAEESAPAASSGTGVTPASEIPEGGSLFDIAEPEETSTPAAKVEPEPEDELEAAGEDAAGDSTTDEPVDRSKDAADTADAAVEPDADDAADEGADEPQAEEPAPAASTTTASSGTGITPASEIPEGGSLFDIAEPEEEQVSATTATSPASPDTDATDESEAEPAGEDAAGDSTTDGPVDRAEDAADTDVEPDEPDHEPAQAEAAGADSDSGLGGKYPAGESMFDLPADATSGSDAASGPAEEPRGEDPAGDSTTDRDVDRAEDAADTDVEPDTDSDDDEPADSSSGITSLKDIKAKYADGGTGDDQASDPPAEADDAAEAEPTTSEDSEDAEDAEEKPKPASSGETHAPKTDQDIGEASSLFDL